MTDWIKHYWRWRNSTVKDEELNSELKLMEGDEAAIRDCFYRDLEFGTGGLRGKMGAGTNRMNLYTVRRATQGLCHYLKKAGLPLSVSICYDSRINSRHFAQEAACVLASNHISVWIYPRLEPTPALSWAVRYLHCGAGVCITASHNPANYNGYKIYDRNGCQITLEMASEIQKEIAAVDIFNGISVCAWEEAAASGKVQWIGEDCLESFLNTVLAQRLSLDDYSGLRVAYTPMNGSGLECVTKILHRAGIENVAVVPEQEKPDGSFPTCPVPNPENPSAMKAGLRFCGQTHADLLIGTDPDCDRVGVAVRVGMDYVLLSGNEVGVLLFDYICKRRIENGTMPGQPVAMTTIVSTDMANAVASKYGVELRRVLTGFKFIGEQIGVLEQQGQTNRFIFGFEESCGYLTGSYVRDKDAVGASMLCCEMAAWYQDKGLSLASVLRDLYDEFGYYHDRTESFEFHKPRGEDRIQEIMSDLRSTPLDRLGEKRVLEMTDHLSGAKAGSNLPKSDVLEFRLENSKLLIRPSGTEPKLKLYLSTRGNTLTDAAMENQKILDDFTRQILLPL